MVNARANESCKLLKPSLIRYTWQLVGLPNLPEKDRDVPVNTDYDLFEVFPDGSVMWRVSIRGTQLALATLAAIGKQTVNECFAKNLRTQRVIGRVNEASTPIPQIKGPA